MKDFSIFGQASQLCESPKTIDLGCISSISRSDFDDRETVVFNTEVPGVEYACLMIENALLLKDSRGGRVYAGFEKLSRLRPVIERYRRIADLSESVFIFGEADWEPPRHPHIRVISLKPDFQLARESFLIADSPSLQVAVVSRTEDSNGDGVRNKMMTAIKTSDANAVMKLAIAVEGVIDWSIAA